MLLTQDTLQANSGEGAAAQRRLEGMSHLIGNTPLLAIDFAFKGTQRTVFAKCEQMNLTGSIKDRMVYHILKTAYASGELQAGTRLSKSPAATPGFRALRSAAPWAIRW